MTRLGTKMEESLRRYALGTLEEDSRLRLEEQLVRDLDVFDALGVIEDELTEEYLDGVLTDAERVAYERQRSVSPDRWHAPEFFATLKARASAAAEPQGGAATSFWSRPVPPAWLAAAAALLVVSLGTNVWHVLRAPAPMAADTAPEVADESAPPVLATPAPPSSDRLAELTAANRELENQLAAERDQLVEAQALAQRLERAAARPTTAIPTFTLAAGLLRSGGSLARVVVPHDVDVVRLVLVLPADEHPLYRAALEDVDGNEVWVQSRLKAETTGEQSAVTVHVPAAALANGDYQMAVSGLTESGDQEGVARYTFRAIPD